MKFDIKSFFQTLKDQKDFGFFLSIILWLRVVLPESLKKVGRKAYGYEKYLKDFGENPNKKMKWIANKLIHKDKFNKYLIAQHKIGLTNLLYYGILYP